MTLDLARAGSVVGRSVIVTPDDRVFCGTADYWWDGVYVSELQMPVRPWQTPSDFMLDELTPKTVDFGTVPAGSTSTLQVDLGKYINSSCRFTVICPAETNPFQVAHNTSDPYALDVTYTPSGWAGPS